MIDLTNMRDYMATVLEINGLNVHTGDLKFLLNNNKLEDIFTYSMPAGWSCRFAKDCRSCTTLKDCRSLNITHDTKHPFSGFGIQDGPHTKFRCFATIDEVMKPTVRMARWHNYLIALAAIKKGKKSKKGSKYMVDIIERSLPPMGRFNKPIRVNVSGDFFNQTYFDAWLKVAVRNPKRIFYGYTKALPYLIKRLKSIPKNFRFVASKGGTHDHLIKEYNLKSATVVKSVQEAKDLGLEIDHDDSHVINGKKDFALLIHSAQPAGTEYAKAWTELKKQGMGGYGKHKQGMINKSKATTKISTAGTVTLRRKA